ncbi:hypothetical protein FDB52_06125 [Clostridium botulinum]|nr:hypothetical protein [Clostridium botulinum]NFN17920.1 hypothetical protein [Clostridium botulinum]NFN48130.1 hypothetical protein [Clostridium botulinum]
MVRDVNLYANINKFKYVHPYEKLTITLISLILCSYVNKNSIIILNIILFLSLCFFTKVEFKVLIKFLKIAIVFSLLTSISFIFEKQYSLMLLLFLRSINGAICIGFFALTTPINHLVYILNKNKYISDVADIAKSLETFLIIIEKDFEVTFKAMDSRGVDSRYINKLICFGKVCAVVFKNLIYRWKEINQGLKNRCYRGKHYYSYEFKINYKNYICIVIYFILYMALIKVI